MTWGEFHCFHKASYNIYTWFCKITVIWEQQPQRILFRNMSVPSPAFSLFWFLEMFQHLSFSCCPLQSLEQKLERDFYSGCFQWDEVHQNDVSGLLKRFIRELPTPLLTAEYLPAFAAVQSESSAEKSFIAIFFLTGIMTECWMWARVLSVMLTKVYCPMLRGDFCVCVLCVSYWLLSSKHRFSLQNMDSWFL